MVHTASVLLQVPFPEVPPDITQTQKVTVLNYLRRQRCLGKEMRSALPTGGTGILSKEKEESLSPVYMKRS